MANSMILMPAGGSASLRNVEVFSTAPHGDNPFSVGDLDQVVRNFYRFTKSTTDGVHVQPPAYDPAWPLTADTGIGHDREQKFLQALLNKEQPLAAGWVTDLWRQGNKLFANIDNIPEAVAKLIDDRQLMWCSAELYEDFRPNGQSYGPGLRRVAYLGSEPPKIKDLAPLPFTVRSFSESSGRLLRVQTTAGPMILCFSEMLPMDRAQMLAALQTLGVDTSKITDVVPDEVVAEWLRSAQGMQKNAEPPKLPEPKPKPAPATMSEEQVLKCSEGVFNRLMTPVLQQLTKLNATVQPLQADIGAAKQQAKRDRIVTFSEDMVKAGKVYPHELDPKGADGKPKPTLVDRLMLLDDSQQVLTFGEGKVTALAAEMEAIKARPPLKTFSEKILPGGGNAGMTADRRRQMLAGSAQGRAILEREAKAKK